ncbi:hypothetical protein K8I61_01665 [bacterium]|nr:hypothetical protein [bacterium]
MTIRFYAAAAILIAAAFVASVSCGDDDDDDDPAEGGDDDASGGDDDTGDDGAGSGDLDFVIDGGAELRGEITSKDGWRLVWDHVYVHLTDVVAWRADIAKHAGETHDGDAGEAGDEHVSPPVNDFYVELTKAAEPSVFITAGGVPAGRYGMIEFNLSPDTPKHGDDDVFGNAFTILVDADKDEEHLFLTVTVRDAYEFLDCGPNPDVAPVTPESAGQAVVGIDASPIFGNVNLAGDDPLNEASIGFQPFADAATTEVLVVKHHDLHDTLGDDLAERFLDSLALAGRTGAARCTGVRHAPTN